MGGCVSTPKDLLMNEGEAPVEVPASPKKAEGETVAQEENTQEVADEKEEPLVDLTEKAVEAKPEEATTETTKAEKEDAKVEEPKAEKTNEDLVTL